MGIYLNPGNSMFRRARNSEIYVDKSKLIAYTNKVLGTEQQYLCVSRPRRFGKSMAANMLAAYYGKGCDSRELFQGLAIETETSFEEHLNKYHVIFLNMQDFLSREHEINQMKALMEKAIRRDLLKAFPDIDYLDREDLIEVLQEIYAEHNIPFIFIIDEWDCIFRENRDNKEAQKIYLDFLRNLLKDKPYVGLAYMTGILPVKKYGSHSALNMFDEYSMIEPGDLAGCVGFTESEVSELCKRYDMDFAETRRWYDGYCFEDEQHIYSPRSIVCAMRFKRFSTYWNKTETFEALRDYIVMNFDGLKDTVIELLSGTHKEVNTQTFTNDMTTFSSVDDVLTLLIHLGYLGYDFATEEVFIPNYEVATEFVNAISVAGWEEVMRAVKRSDELLQATWNKNAAEVAQGIEEAHFETSVLKYNDENSLSCVISLAYYSARIYYTIFRELPTGKGYADIVFLPRKNYQDKPAMIVELKWNQTAQGAISQIKERRYVKALEGYSGNILLVGISYDKDSKKHECKIEDWSLR